MLPTTMKAATCRRYGGPEGVQIEDLPVPVPAKGEVLVRVDAVAVNSADWRLRSLEVPKGFGLMVRLAMGWSRPRNPVLGFDAAGEVVGIGPGVTRVAVGDRVAVNSEHRRGGHAQYMLVPPKAVIVPIPDPVDTDQAAAAIFGGTTAVHFLDKSGLRAGQSLLINGASGTVGLAMVQLAVARGLRVTGVCSGKNAALLRELGAEHVIDYTQTPFDRIDAQYDGVADLVGNAPWSVAKGKIAPNGRYLMVVATSMWDLITAGTKGGAGRKVIAGTVAPTAQMIGDLLRGLADGTWRAVIDSTYPLTQARDAHARVDGRRKVGSVLLHPHRG